MKNMREIILDLREIYQSDRERYSYGNLLKQMEENGDFLSKSTLSRLFGEKWEDYSFDYQNTLFPIVKVMIGADETDNNIEWDSDTAKLALKIKIDSENEIKKAKDEYLTKLEEETLKFQRSLEFVKNQIELKDKRIDQLMNDNSKLVNHILDCPYRKGCNVNED